MGRQVAAEIGAACYYETSVLHHHGITEVMHNVIRAALVSRREKHFWNSLGNMKRISAPACQPPFLPPKPKTPTVMIPPFHIDQDIETLLQNQKFCDVIFLAQGVCFPAHRVILVAASAVFEELFTKDWKSNQEQFSTVPRDVKPSHSQAMSKSNTLSSTLKRSGSTAKKDKVTSDTAKLLENDEIDTSMSSLETLAPTPPIEPQVYKVTLNHPAFTQIELQVKYSFDLLLCRFSTEK